MSYIPVPKETVAAAAADKAREFRESLREWQEILAAEKERKIVEAMRPRWFGLLRLSRKQAEEKCRDAGEAFLDYFMSGTIAQSARRAERLQNLADRAEDAVHLNAEDCAFLFPPTQETEER